MIFLRRRYLLAAGFMVLLSCLVSLKVLGMYEQKYYMAVLAPIFRGSGDRPCISLMFNVDWGEEHIPEVLRILKEKDVRATFFITGTWAEKNPDLVRRIAEEGHEIGNHGGSHVHIEGMKKADLQKLILSGEEKILRVSGKKPSSIFAPPYGEWSDQIVQYAQEIGYSTILWTVDTVDWKLPPAEIIWKRALAGVVPGALVLLHPTEPTVSALGTIIDGIREKGYVLVPVSENVFSPAK